MHSKSSNSVIQAKANTKRICLGKIVAAHGVKGLVKVVPFGDDYELLEALSPLYRNENSQESLTLSIRGTAGKFILASVQGCDNRNSAEDIAGTELWVDRTSLPALESDDEFYIEDLIGLQIQGSDGQALGILISVQNFGAGDLFEVKPVSGSQSFYIPYRDEYVHEINVASGYILVTNVENLMM